MSIEVCIISGHVGSDPNMRYLQDGKPVCSFSVAVSRGKDRPPNWYRVSAWENLAELCNQYVTKGMNITVSGRIQASAWIDQSGKAQASLELTARDVQFGGKSSGTDRQPAPAGASDPAEDLNDIPF